MGEVKLLGAVTSLFAYRVQWALKLKGVEYEYIEEDLKNKSPLLLNSNPINKKVPVLLHGDKPVVESLVILEYIDETWTENPLLPADPYGRALARFWAKFGDEKCVMCAFNAGRSEGEEKEKAIASAKELLGFLEGQLIEGKEFFGGEKMGFVDLALGWIPLWLGVMEEAGGMKLLDAESFPFLHQWALNFVQIPLIKECLPPRDTLLNFMRSIMAPNKKSN